MGAQLCGNLIEDDRNSLRHIAEQHLAFLLRRHTHLGFGIRIHGGFPG